MVKKRFALNEGRAGLFCFPVTHETLFKSHNCIIIDKTNNFQIF
jgi:hypothetical protein